MGYNRDKKLISPLFIMPFIWGVLLLLFNIIPHRLYSLQPQFLQAILIWVFVFMITGFFISFVKFENIISIYSPKIFSIYYYVVIICAPLTIFLIVREALKVGPEFFFIKLRLMNMGLDQDESFSLGPLVYINNLTNIVCLLFTFYIDKVSKRKYYIVLVITFFLSLITLARTNILMLLIGIFIIMYIKKKLTRRIVTQLIIGIVFFLALLSFFRSLVPWEDNSSFFDTFSVYLFSGMSAFDTIRYEPQIQLGGYSFRFFYVLANTMGGNFEIKQNILPYTYIPLPTNVYTIMFPFYKDFGYWGVGVFGSLYGIIFGLTYMLSKGRNDIAVIFFALIFPCLILQFMGENIFLNLSTYLQSIIILLIPYYLKRI